MPALDKLTLRNASIHSARQLAGPDRRVRYEQHSVVVPIDEWPWWATVAVCTTYAAADAARRLLSGDAARAARNPE